MPCRLKCGVYAGADEAGGASEENLHALIESEGVSLHTGVGRQADRHALILRLFQQCVKSGGPLTAIDESGRPSMRT